MDETMTGVFKCRCCGAEIKEKTSVARSVAWAIKDMKDDTCDCQSSTSLPGSSLPERFVVHWCEKNKILHLRSHWMGSRGRKIVTVKRLAYRR